MEQYQRDQQQLQQYYQQQRIMELQMARQRQMEMEAQNVTRFGMMRDRALSAIAPIGGYVPSEMGLGRNIGLPNAQGVPSQSFFGTVADAAVGGGGLFFRTAGFQFNMSEIAVRQRARQALRVRAGQMENRFLDSITPLFLQRRFGRVGMGDIEERSLDIMDAFSGMRGRGANLVTGRGILGTQAAEVAEEFTKALNQEFKGKLGPEAFGQLQTAALNTLTSQDIAGLGGALGFDEEGAKNLLREAVKELQGIARNTGMATSRLGELAAENRSMGNDLSDLTRIGEVVGRSGTTTTVSREQQLRLGMSLTAQGRQIGVEDAGAFGQRMLQDVLDLQSAFNVKAAQRADLFRYGGINEFDAAARVQGRRVEAGQFFAQQMTPTMGVLGMGLDASLRKGLMGFMGDVSQAIVDDPFAPLKARTNFRTQQMMIENNTRLAIRNAQNVVEMMGIDDPEAVRAMQVQMVARSTNRTEMDARREMNLIEAEDRQVEIAVGNVSGLTDEQRESLVHRIGVGRDTFRRYGFGMSDILNPRVLRRFAQDPTKDALDMALDLVREEDQTDAFASIGAVDPGEEGSLVHSYSSTGAIGETAGMQMDEQELEDAIAATEGMSAQERVSYSDVGLHYVAPEGKGRSDVQREFPGARFVEITPGLNPRVMITPTDSRQAAAMREAGYTRFSMRIGRAANNRDVQRAAIQAEFSPDRLLETMSRNDLLTEAFASRVADLDERFEGVQLGNAEYVMGLIEDAGLRDSFGQLTETFKEAIGQQGMRDLSKMALTQFSRGMTRVNEKAEQSATLGTKNNAMYVRPAPGAEFFG